nr:hypothetical protein [Tanacetum cinerariifolium]
MESHTGVVEETLCSTNFTINTSKPTTPLHGSYPHPSEVTGISSKVDLVSRSLHVLCIPGTVNVVALLGVQLNTLGDIDNLTKDIELGSKLESSKAMPSDLIMQSMDINTKSTSYARAAGASTKEQLKVNSNFRPLVVDHVFNGVNISILCKFVKKGKHGLIRTMMNTNGFFFFKFDSWAGLEAVLEGGPWMIRNSLIILKKWSMDTSLLKEELTRILIWVKLHDVPLQVFEEDGISLIATFIGKPADLVDVITIGIPSFTVDDFTKETIRVVNPIVTTSNAVTHTIKKSNDGFQMVGKKKKRKGKSKSTNGGEFASPSVKQNIRYEPKSTISTPKKGANNVDNASISTSMLKTIVTSSKNDNIITSNSYYALND